jgi:hypothetical protein
MNQLDAAIVTPLVCRIGRQASSVNWRARQGEPSAAGRDIAIAPERDSVRARHFTRFSRTNPLPKSLPTLCLGEILKVVFVDL